MTGLLLGVDGGNTKTVALIATADGTIVGAGRVSGVADMYFVPVEAAMGVIEAAVEAALADAGVTAPDLLAAGWSLAGADWPEDHELLAGELRRRWPTAPGTVVNDGIGGLRAAIPPWPGDRRRLRPWCGDGRARA